MNGAELQTLARAVADAGAPGVPTVVLVREVPLFELELAALELAENTELPPAEAAVLGLARALGELSPADIDGYLGLGETVSQGLVSHLLDAALLEVCPAEPSPEPRPVEPSGIRGFFRRLFGAKPPPIAPVAAAGRVATAARTLYEPRARRVPMCRLSPHGVAALEHRAIVRRRVQSARLLVMADPVLVLRVLDEKHQHHAQHRRPTPLEPDAVPRSLRTIDRELGLPAHERLAACGVGDHLTGLRGELVGVVPGSQWEVRPHGRRDHSALLILAGFPSSDAEGVRWRPYLRQSDRIRDCPQLPVARALEPRSLSGLLATLRAAGPLPSLAALRPDGAFALRYGDAQVTSSVGQADRPEDTFLAAEAPGWWVGLRVHAVPATPAAAHATFYELLNRRASALRRSFDATCAEVAAGLVAYWDEDPGLPSADQAAIQLWAHAEHRAALCMRRRHRDLVAPYASEAGR